MKRISLGVFLTLLIGCATTKEYAPIVDPSSIADQSTYESHLKECEGITDAVDYSDEEAVAALKGAGVGAGVVGAGASVVAATGGVVLAPVAVPIAVVAAGVGALTNSSKTDKNEQRMRAAVFNGCLRERGYTVLSDEDAAY